MNRREFLKITPGLSLIPTLLVQKRALYELYEIEPTNWTMRITRNGKISDLFTGVDYLWALYFIEKQIKPNDLVIEHYKNCSITNNYEQFVTEQRKSKEFFLGTIKSLRLAGTNKPVGGGCVIL